MADCLFFNHGCAFRNLKLKEAIRQAFIVSDLFRHRTWRTFPVGILPLFQADRKVSVHIDFKSPGSRPSYVTSSRPIRFSKNVIPPGLFHLKQASGEPQTRRSSIFPVDRKQVSRSSPYHFGNIVPQTRQESCMGNSWHSNLE